MENQCTVVLITVPSMEVGELIATQLIEQRAAACVNILPAIRSIYTWEGQTQTETEVLLLVKTRSDLFEKRVIPLVSSLHPYEVPEIIALPIIQGNHPYLDWIAASTTT